MKRIITMFIVLLLGYQILIAQGELPRRAYWGVRFSEQAGHLIINSVDDGFSFYKAGLRLNDLILSVDGIRMHKQGDLLELLEAGIAGTRLEVQILRGQDTSNIVVEAEPYPYEKVEGVHFDYGSFLSDQGDHLRTIVSRPKEMEGKLPAVLFIQWLSGDPIDAHPLYNDGNIQLIHDLSKAGYLL